MNVDHDGLGIARPTLSATLNSDNQLQRDTGTSPGFMKRRCGGHE